VSNRKENLTESGKKDIILLGLGNLLVEDEGIGLHVIKHINAHYRFEPAIEIVDGGTAGFELLPFFEDYDRILMVDAVEFGEAPGYVGRMENDDILTQLKNNMSLHHLGITDVLSSVKLLEYDPSQIILIGVQPQSMEVRMGLSELLRSRIEPVTRELLRILESWGVVAIPVKNARHIDAAHGLIE